ncbi:hypothetical protein [Terasakiella sp. SH-1]|uniref:hypothetical protein n=1 Tax=Terasakiella sp. SH-1 TaxID=2560057 RepID=UPI0010746B4F|nr:hypothetical protein [Terasakiella sp. SH-1]
MIEDAEEWAQIVNAAWTLYNSFEKEKAAQSKADTKYNEYEGFISERDRIKDTAAAAPYHCRIYGWRQG